MSTIEDDLNANIKTVIWTRQKNVFFFVPNIIGYFRILLILASWISHALSRPNMTLTFYIGAAILDFFDGFAARRLNQSSVFGAWFDVCIDVVARTTMWSMVFSSRLVSSLPTSFASISLSFPWGQLIASLEWLSFVCNHAIYGSRWKSRMMTTDSTIITNDVMISHPEVHRDCTSTRQDVDVPSVGAVPPAWVAKCFENGFKSPLGVFVIAGIHCLPPLLYGWFVNISDENCLWFVYKALLEWNLVTIPFLISGRFYAACVECWIIWDHVKFLATRKED